ncbi:MAG: hypothetical protein LBB91_09975 [Clostridiales bacterium]|nr:hypothetical protein [Clostridiales bacterium]
MDYLRTCLEGMTVEKLKQQIQYLGAKTSKTRKQDLVDMLCRYYYDPKSPVDLYKRLNTYECELLTYIVQSNYKPMEEDLDAIAKAHKFKFEYRPYYYSVHYSVKYTRKESPLPGFFVKGYAGSPFEDYLKEVIPPYFRQFKVCDVGDPDAYEMISDRQNQYRDFDRLLSFVNNNKVSATKAGNNMNKAPFLKFYQTVDYDELWRGKASRIEDIRNVGETTLSFGMIQLLRCAKVLDIVKEKFVPGDNATKYAGLAMPEKAKFLYDAYINHGNSIIDECARIFASKLKFSRKNYNLSGVRKVIVYI